MTGSGTVVKNLLIEGKRAGDEAMLVMGHFRDRTNSELGIPEGVPVETVRFNCGDVTERCLRFPVPVFSAGGFSFPCIRFTELSNQQLSQYIEAFSSCLAKAVRVFKPDVIHTHHLFLLNNIARQAAPNIPLVSTCHGTELKMLDDDSTLLPLVSEGVNGADHIIAISDAVKEQAIGLFGLERGNISVVYNGYDSNTFFPREMKRNEVLGQYGIDAARFNSVVLSAAKFSEWKGIEYLINAACQYGSSKNLTLICGDGSDKLRGRYNALIQEYKLDDNVKIITPPVNRTDKIAELMAVTDVFVLPTVGTGEPFGLVLLEAVAAGCKIIFSNIGGPPGFVPRCLIENGLAFAIDPLKYIGSQPDLTDTGAYASRIAEAAVRLLNTKVTFAMRERIAAAVKHLTWGTAYKKLQKIYKEVI
jgi:glycosyltransferase involved in cell wall biosynthesis